MRSLLTVLILSCGLSGCAVVAAPPAYTTVGYSNSGSFGYVDYNDDYYGLGTDWYGGTPNYYNTVIYSSD